MHCGEEPRSGEDERQRDERKEVGLARSGESAHETTVQESRSGIIQKNLIRAEEP